MIDVYGMSSPNVVKITIMLEELGLPYRQHHVNVFAGDQHEAQFLEISPNNKVPVIVDADGPGGAALPVFESGAILIYLAEKTGRLLPAGGAARVTVLEWLMVQLTAVGPMFGQLVHFTRYAPPGNDYSCSATPARCGVSSRCWKGGCGKRPTSAANRISIADVATWPWIRTASGIYPWLAEAAAGGRRAGGVAGARALVQAHRRAARRSSAVSPAASASSRIDKAAFGSADAGGLRPLLQPRQVPALGRIAMKFWQMLTWMEPEQILEVARFAEEVGFEGVMLGDHGVFPRDVKAAYPYSADGKPPMAPDSWYPDCWATIGAISAVTRRIRFAVAVYVLPLRNVFEVARATGTLAHPQQRPLHPRRRHRLDEGRVRHLRGGLPHPRQALRRAARRAAQALGRRHGGAPRRAHRLSAAADLPGARARRCRSSPAAPRRWRCGVRPTRPTAGSAPATRPRKCRGYWPSSAACGAKPAASSCRLRPSSGCRRRRTLATFQRLHEAGHERRGELPVHLSRRASARGSMTRSV